MTIDELIDGIIKREKGYVDNPDDRGGKTNWGITEQVARENGYTGDMRDLPVSTARQIYFKKYYSGPGFDKIAALSPLIAEEVTDTGVNMGQVWGAMFLQRGLNAFNLKATVYPDVKVDGDFGPKSLAALASYLRFRGKEGERVMLKALDHLQGARYIELAEGREANETFVYGWIKERT